jgi:2-polyprenyl-3-methyl-5-hydroxy-6-metoxy-1,4-benzoquinol methylase
MRVITVFSHKMVQKARWSKNLFRVTLNGNMGGNIQKRFDGVARSKTFRNIVETFTLDKKAVLDIGCSFGEFLAHFGDGSVGISISHEEVAYGKAEGLDIRYGNIEEGDLVLTEQFDVIFANNIFEHLYSPHDFLNKIKKHLKPEGILILGVPCIPKMVSLTHIRKFRGAFAEQHINFFTRDTLLHTVMRAGWIPQMARGFRFKNSVVDTLLNPIYPHFYVIATIDTDFHYTEKRMKELAGYTTTS